MNVILYNFLLSFKNDLTLIEKLDYKTSLSSNWFWILLVYHQLIVYYFNLTLFICMIIVVDSINYFWNRGQSHQIYNFREINQ